MKIRKLNRQDKAAFVMLAKQFYSTDSVASPIPEKNILNAFDEIIADSPYIDGFLILENGNAAGYALLIYTYSMEAGGMVAVLDELFIHPHYQGLGLGSAFLQYMEKHLSERIKAFRLEFMPCKDQLRRLYEKNGFRMMKYASMIHDADNQVKHNCVPGP